MIGGKDFSIIALLVLGICFLLGVTLLRCEGRPERGEVLGTAEGVDLPKGGSPKAVDTGIANQEEPGRADAVRGRQPFLLLKGVQK